MAARVDGAQHGAQGDQGLAGADLALEQAIHRVRPGEVVLDLGADLALSAGQLERQPRVEGGQQRALVTRPGLGTLGAQLGPAAGQHELGDQRLVEAEPSLGRADLTEVVRGVDPVQRGPGVDEGVLVAHRVRQQLGHLVEDGPGEADRALEVPRVDALGLRVDRVQVADRVDGGLRALLPVVVRSEERHLRVGELPLATERAHLADEDAAAAGRESPGLPVGDVLRLGEERHLQGRAVGREDGVEAVGAPAGTAIGVGVDLGAGDLADDGQHLAVLEVGHLGQLARLHVAARVVAQQVVDGAQAQPLDDLLALGRLVAQDRLDR